MLREDVSLRVKITSELVSEICGGSAVSKCGALKIQLSLPCQKGPPPPSLSFSIHLILPSQRKSELASRKFFRSALPSLAQRSSALSPPARSAHSVGRSGTFLCPPSLLLVPLPLKIHHCISRSLSLPHPSSLAPSDKKSACERL